MRSIACVFGLLMDVESELAICIQVHLSLEHTLHHFTLELRRSHAAVGGERFESEDQGVSRIDLTH
jgi:hypothetical protein